MVVKENFSRDMAEMLAGDIDSSVRALRSGTTAHPHRPRRRPHC
jgi:hypothetical protein